MSYGLFVVRDLLNVLLAQNIPKHDAFLHFCEDVDLFNGVNLACYIIIEIIPLLSVGYLNWRNFKKEKTVRESKDSQKHNVKTDEMENLMTVES